MELTYSANENTGAGVMPALFSLAVVLVLFMSILVVERLTR